MKSILRIALVSVLGIFLMLPFIEKRMIFPGAYWGGPSKPPSLPGLEVWQRQILNDETVEALFIPASTNKRVRGTVLYAHGNGEVADTWAERLMAYPTQLGLNVLMIEYRGYSRSGGSPSQAVIRDDYVHFYDELLKRKGPQDIVVFHGRSLGGGVLVDLLQHRQPTHLILEFTFTSLARVAHELYRIPSFLIRSKFDSLLVLEGLDIPSLVIHGTHDTLIPVAHAHENYNALSGHKEMYLLNGHGHNDMPADPQAYWEKIQSFLAIEGQSL